MQQKISKHELARAYAPNLTEKAALNRLSVWIRGNKKLLKALKRTGYVGTEKYFFQNQIQLIYRYLGEP